MDISYYEAFFHDGELKNIEHKNDTVVLTMCSSEMDYDDVADKHIELAQDPITCIKGKLHIEEVEQITISEQPFHKKLKMFYDDAEIFKLKIEKRRVEICIKWTDFPPKPRKSDFSVIQIQGKKIYWENLPKLPWD